MTEEERLARVLYDAEFPMGHYDTISPIAQQQWCRQASHVLAHGYRPPEIPSLPPWPVTKEAVDAFNAAPFHSGNDYRTQALGLRAAAPHLWRAWVGQLADGEIEAIVVAWKTAPSYEGGLAAVRAHLLELGEL